SPDQQAVSTKRTVGASPTRHRGPQVPRLTSWAAPSVVSTTRLHAAGHTAHSRYAGTDDGRGTDQSLDANRLTLMSGRSLHHPPRQSARSLARMLWRYEGSASSLAADSIQSIAWSVSCD